MNPYSVDQNAFQTQADQRFNSFSDPMNPVNLNGGAGWGINPAYMTPSYMSPYRPPYTGPNPNPGATASPGFWNSVYNLTPFAGGGVNYGGQTYGQNTEFYNGITYKPMDAAASVAQNFVVPGLFGMAAYKYLDKPGGRFGGAIGRSAALGLFGTGEAGLSAAHVAGGIGSLAGRAFLPFAAVQAASSLVDRTIFDPYINQREMTATLRNNFAGVTFGDGSGNSVTGGGFSRAAAGTQARSLSLMGALDKTFGQGEISQLTDFASRSGLLDNVQGGQIAERMKGIVRQVKTVMSIANTSDFREAIETISKLQSAGVGPGNMVGVAGALGGAAAIGGTSVSKLMNTVGATGQYLFQSNGLTPYVGQLKAAQAYASYEAAFRSGLVSPQLLSRFGGKEGAAQSAVTGMLGMAQSPYMGMMGYNAMFGGGQAGTMVGTMGAFGGSMAGNPLQNMGKFNLARPDIVSSMLEHGGLKHIQTMLGQMGQVTPGAMINGKVSDAAAYEMLTKSFGLTDDQARAMLHQLQSYTDPMVMAQMRAGTDKANTDAFLKFGDQEGLNKGFLTPYTQAVTAAGRNVLASTSGFVGNMLGGGNSFGDWIEQKFTSGMYGSFSPLRSGGKDYAKFKEYGYSDVGNYSSRHESTISKINSLAKRGDADARALLGTSGRVRENILYKLAKDGKISGDYLDSGQVKSLSQELDLRPTESVSGRAEEAGALQSAWDKTFTRGGFSGLEADEWISMTDDAASMLKSGKSSGSEWDNLVSNFERKTGRQGLNMADIQKYVDDAAVNSETTGAYGRGEAWKRLSDGGRKSYSEVMSLLKGPGGASYLSKILGRNVDPSKMSEVDIGVALSGSNVLQARRSYSDIKYTDPARLRDSHDEVIAREKQFQEASDLGNNSNIDFGTMKNIKQYFDDFGQSTRVFSDAVSRMPGAGGGGKTLLEELMPGPRRQTK